MNKTFIKATEERCEFEHHVAAPYFRKSFEVEFLPTKASLSICGLGFYCIWVNGKEITKGALAPYISNPDHFCYYDTYDLLRYLKKGKNAIGVLLGNGMMNPLGGVEWNFDQAPWVGPLALRWNVKFLEKGMSAFSLRRIRASEFTPRPLPSTICGLASITMPERRTRAGLCPTLTTEIGSPLCPPTLREESFDSAKPSPLG